MAKVADFVDVMYAGKIVETGTIDEIFYEPRHPYTWGLLSAMPDLDTDDDRLYAIPGSPPNLLHEKVGDAFAPRNEFALNIDDRVEPPMFEITIPTMRPPGCWTRELLRWKCRRSSPSACQHERGCKEREGA